MTNDHDHSNSGQAPSQTLDDDAKLQRLIRLSHIFSSAVREILESKLLDEATELPLTPAQFHVLKLMTVKGDHQVGELAEFLGISPPAVTKNIDKLERFGLVVRKPSLDDRRAVILSASLKGKRVVQRYEQLIVTRLAPILEDFTPAETDQMCDLLERFSVSILKRERTGRGFCLRCAAYIETGCPVGHVRGTCPYDSVPERGATTSDKT